MTNMDRIYCIRKFFLLAVASLVFIYPIKVSAISSTPNFPSCVNPSGKQVVAYTSGTHGVPGRSEAFSGVDIVYEQSNKNYTQCLCVSGGEGIQTNWWKTGSITEEEIDFLKADNWILVPDGSLWGLEKASYMAKNIAYSCNSDNRGGSGSSSNSSSDGQVQGATTTRFGQVLGLATTGTLPAIVVYFVLGSILVLISRLLKK
jgi:hypothetical protein